MGCSARDGESVLGVPKTPNGIVRVEIPNPSRGRDAQRAPGHRWVEGKLGKIGENWDFHCCPASETPVPGSRWMENAKEAEQVQKGFEFCTGELPALGCKQTEK